jgi:uncharacterized coiled-coil protein SlyX
MTNGSDIIGYTLAEIALVLLFALVAVFLPSYSKASKQLKEVEKANRQVAEQREEVRLLKSQLAELQTRTADEPRAADLKSKQTPSCKELGVDTGFLFTATITSADTYVVNGQEVNSDQLRNMFRDALNVAARKQCKESVRVFYSARVSTAEYDEALRKIEQLFYVSRGGLASGVAAN